MTEKEYSKSAQDRKLTWKEVVRNALIKLGGQGHLSEINNEIEGHIKTRTNPTWRDTIRRVVRQYKIFQPVPPERSGIYRLIEEVPITVERQVFTEEPEIDHGIAQGMLVTLGNVYGYETFTPLRDQTTRKFQERTLSTLVTIADCSDIFKGPNVSKIREIDVLWFDEDDYGLFPRYAFEVEETTGVKSGLDRLLKIPRRFSVKFYIIAPSNKEEELFNRYVNQTPFREYKDKFSFKNYKELEELFNSALVHDNCRKLFGIFERKK
jgi:hypothetical protein